MSNFSTSGNTGRQAFLSLCGLSHEVCVAVTQNEYWQQLIKDSSISISYSGNYVPVELEYFCREEEEPTLQLIIKSQHEKDNKQFDSICTRIHYDLISFENNDRPIYDSDKNQVIVFGSLFNSLPSDLFDLERNLLGQRNCNIKKIRNSLGCSIEIDGSSPRRYRFIIHHENQIIMDLAAIQIQALVKQAQSQYLMTYATKIGRASIRHLEQMESSILPLDPEAYPSFKPFHPAAKRKRLDDEQQLTTNQPIVDSDQSDDEATDDDKREQRREQVEILLNRICERMQSRTPRDQIAKLREDSSQIKSYFRSSIGSKIVTNESEFSIELVEHEIDLRTRGTNAHKCTLVFNKLLKMGPGVRDHLKKTAKVRAYERLKTLTRDTPRENLLLKPTRDGLWKVVVKPKDDE